MVNAFTKRGSQDFGIDGYNMPVSGSPKKTSSGVIPKNKSPGPIEAEAKYRKQFPGSGAYTLREDKTWADQLTKSESRPNLGKAPRMMMADLVALNNSKPEKSTPSPNDYKVYKEKFLPSLGKGGGSLLSA